MTKLLREALNTASSLSKLVNPLRAKAGMGGNFWRAQSSDTDFASEGKCKIRERKLNPFSTAKGSHFGLSSVGAFLCFLVIVALPFVIIIKTHELLPFGDVWDDGIRESMAILNHQFSLAQFFHYLFSFHNEHRQVLSRVLLTLEVFFAPTTTVYIALISVLGGCFSLFSLALLLKKYDRFNWRIIALISGIFLSVAQLESWLWTYTWMFPYLSLFMVLSLLSLLQRKYGLTLALISSALGTLLMANGLLIWITTLITLIALQLLTTQKMGWVKIFIYFLVSLLVIKLYTLGMISQGLNFHDLKGATLFFFAFLGSEFSLGKFSGFAIIMGLIYGFLWVVLSLRILTSRFNEQTPSPILLILLWGMANFSLLNAIAGAFGRPVLVGFQGAMASRYVPLSAIGLAALVIAFYLLFKTFKKRFQKFLYIALAFLVLNITGKTLYGYEQAFYRNSNISPSVLAFQNKTILPSAGDIYPPLNQSITPVVIPYLQSAMNPYRNYTPLIGQPFNSSNQPTLTSIPVHAISMKTPYKKIPDDTLQLIQSQGFHVGVPVFIQFNGNPQSFNQILLADKEGRICGITVLKMAFLSYLFAQNEWLNYQGFKLLNCDVTQAFGEK